MNSFGYTERARNINAAQAEVHTAFKAVRNRRDENDPATRRWLEAIKAFRNAYDRVYPASLKQLEEGSISTLDVSSADILDFLEADPVFFRSGYMKQRLTRELKRRALNLHELRRAQGIVLAGVKKSFRREFREYCSLALNLDDAYFRAELSDLARSVDESIALRARWVLDALILASRS